MIGRVVACIFFAGLVSSAAQPEFEVASVKPANPDVGLMDRHLPTLNVEPGRNLSFANLGLRDLIMLAYGVGARQIAGPDFLSPASGVRFDIVAKTPADAKKEQIPLMLRTLLAQRFKLALRREQKEMSVYALAVGSGGSKLKESASGDTGESGCTRSSAQTPGVSAAAVCHKMTAGSLAQQVALLAPGYFDRPVVDMTGLKGTYDLTLEWITRPQAEAGEDGPTMYVALEKLGLKLEARKQPMEILVVDHCEKVPAEN
ncbi:MAG: TIGR03435 family protein [Bryobacteraceae bacterium]|jgi:uncharacterized protein (TIGR03435 family)